MNKLNSVRSKLSNYGIYIAFVAIFIVLSFLSDSFLTVQNMLNLTRQASFNGLLAIGMTFTVMTGGIDLSVGSIMAMSALAAATFSTTNSALVLPTGVAIAVGLAVGALAGLVNGLIITKGSVPPFIATLATQMVFRGACLVFTNGQPITSYIESYKWLGQGYILGIPVPVYLYLVLVLVSVYLLHYAKFGRHVYAVGGNPQAARASGLNIHKIAILTYIISGVLAAFSGIALSSRVNATSPILGQTYESDAIAAAVMGGTSFTGGVGTIPGTIVGTFIIAMISNGLDMMGVSSYYQQIVKGVIILIAVLADSMKGMKK